MEKQNNGVITDKNFKSNKDELISNEKKQIDEMAKIIDDNHGFIVSSVETAKALYNAGYRKETQGEWLSAYEYALKLGNIDENRLEQLKQDKIWKFCSYCEQQVNGYRNYCPNCGAKMRGE